MKLLLVHNRYRQPGGEDEVFLRQSELLRSAGHEVLEYTRHNDEIVDDGILSKANLAARTLWAWDSVPLLQARPGSLPQHVSIDLSRCLLRLPAGRNTGGSIST